MQLLSGHPGMFESCLDAGWPLAEIASKFTSHDPGLLDHWVFGGGVTTEGSGVVMIPDDQGLHVAFKLTLFNGVGEEVFLAFSPLNLSMEEVLQSPLGKGLRHVVSSSGQAFFMVRKTDWQPIFTGDVLERITGLTMDDLRHNPELWWSDVVPEDHDRIAEMRQAIQREGFWTGVIRRRDSNDVVHPLEWHVATVPSPIPEMAELIVGVIADAAEISQLKDKVSLLH
ncbi:MAG: hypothetical protein KDK74_16520, partial [Cephaloticoccus sp.]|nr:hypothetical protein [Cephaloticoccus sp.]